VCTHYCNYIASLRIPLISLNGQSLAIEFRMVTIGISKPATSSDVAYV
jgi:hypothetical protein